MISSLPVIHFFTQRRYILALLLFLGNFNVFSLRVNLSVAIVAMTRGIEPEFNWSSKAQGLLLSSFSYGYISTQLIGGIAASKIGGRRLYGAGIFCTGILCIIFPLVSKFGLGALVAVRVLMGVSEGVVFPCLHSIWSKWAPPMERSRLNSFAFAGNYIGTLTMMPVSSFLAENFGWRSVFYVTGGIGVVWYFLWLAIVKESPNVDPYITPEEKKYIIDCLGESSQASHAPPVPWKSILTSKAVWAVASANFCSNWGSDTVLTQLPTYISDISDYSLNLNGVLSSLPYLSISILLIPTSYVADRVQKSGKMTTTQVRKYFQCGGFLLQASFVLLTAYFIDPIYSIAALVMSGGFGSFSVVGYATNVLDIGPAFAGILFGISNTIGSIPGICSPLVTGFIVQNQVGFNFGKKHKGDRLIKIFRNLRNGVWFTLYLQSCILLA